MPERLRCCFTMKYTVHLECAVNSVLQLHYHLSFLCINMSTPRTFYNGNRNPARSCQSTKKNPPPNKHDRLGFFSIKNTNPEYLQAVEN